MQVQKREFFYLSNLLSLLRLILLIPFAWLITRQSAAADLALLLVAATAALTDFLDGYFSRKLNQVTDLGKILDPLADKIDLGVGLVLLVIFRQFPLPLAVYLIYRDVLIVTLGWMGTRKLGHPTPANFWGKLNTTVIALACILFLIGPDYTLTRIALLLSYVTIVISGLSYARLGQKILFSGRWSKTLYWSALLVLTGLLVSVTLNMKFI